MSPKVLKTEAEYEQALAIISSLLSAEDGTPEADALELWSKLVRDWEEEHYPIPLPDPVDAIVFRMEQQGLTRADLEPFLGGKSRVSEVLSRKRTLSLSMIRRLHRGLGIPAEVLLAEPGAALSECPVDDWSAFPLAEMYKRGWFEGLATSLGDLKERAEELLWPMLSAAGPLRPQAMLARQKVRAGSAADDCALWAWRARVVRRARDMNVAARDQGTLDRTFLTEVAHLSQLPDGARVAGHLLAANGICFVVEPHLPRTHIDGAALRVDGLPVIVALTLRHDRLDSFWFTLCHELAHLVLHLNKPEPAGFIDDLDAEQSNDLEAEADQAARDAMIPAAEWDDFVRGGVPARQAITDRARAWRVSPAVVAGRYQFEHDAYKLHRSLLGSGQVRRVFGCSGERG
ncbi:MAG: ImmA/IrrE family metallo-endopeptidase [Armatimonadetes bacterium]|nr:ImmA/IrrE family metallo-endopeptidase [Armatimonadota bacterium]